MKQHITIDDLNKLSDKGKERLRKWWKPEYGDNYAYHKYTHKGIWKYEEHIYVDEIGYDLIDPTIASDIIPNKRDYPLLSIGQMIEFLDEYTNNKGWFMQNIYLTAIGGYTLEKPKEEGYWIARLLQTLELCDVLWEACIEKLECEEV